MVIGLCAFALVRTVASWEISVVHSSNEYGAGKNVFSPNENVYVKGSGFEHDTTYCLYIVPHQATWNDGETIPSRIPGTSTTVSSDASGNIPPTIIWNQPLTPGKYDILIDVNCNGKYDKNTDILLDNGVQVTAGFFVIPEYIIGTILGLAGCFAAYGAFRLFKSKDKASGSR
jgi:hypothetical protein